MKFGLFFAIAGPFAVPETFEALVRSADEVGIESIWTVEHVVVPVGYESQYPYSKDGRMPGPENSPIGDPLVALGYAAAISNNLRLATGIIILPQRHPTYVAKEVATLDVLSKGRVQLGVGIGWLEEEFDGLGVPFHERVGRTEESIEALRSLWSDGASEVHGKYYDWNAVESNPKPPGGRVPIHVGGHVAGAARRAARLGDGFFPARADTLDANLVALREECDAIGRDPGEIEISTGGNISVDDVKVLEDKGVSRVVTGPPGFTPEDVTKGLETMADQVLSKF